MSTLEARLGERIRDARKARGWSQERLAQEMSVAGFEIRQSAIAKTESARRPISFSEAVAFASILGLNLSTLEATHGDGFVRGYQAALRDLSQHIDGHLKEWNS